MLSFKVRAHDDFGVKRVGMEWQGVAERPSTKTAKGERVLAAGGNDKESLNVSGTFSAKSLDIEPQLLHATRLRRGLFSGAQARLLAHVRPVRAQSPSSMRSG